MGDKVDCYFRLALAKLPTFYIFYVFILDDWMQKGPSYYGARGDSGTFTIQCQLRAKMMLNTLHSLILVVGYSCSRYRMDERSEMKYINKRTNECAPD